jgi:hypothetical protein
MGNLDVNRNAAAEIRRAQEAARQAALERQRLMAEEARQAEQARQRDAAQPAEAPTTIDRDTFVQDAEIAGTTEQQREALYAQFDKDGEAGLSADEFDAAFTEAMGDAPAPDDKTSSAVQDELDNAFKDDTDTEKDLQDAAGKVESADDVHAIMAAAQARGVNQQALLQKVLDARDPDAEDPSTSLFEAVAEHYDRLDKPERADAVRAAGNPNIDRGVRGDLTLALKDGTDTAQDLKDAARHAKSADDLEAIMATQRATGSSSPDALLKEALLELDETSDEPNTELIGAIADQYETLGKADHAAALRVAAKPETEVQLRKEIIHALQDDKNTEQDIRDAAKLADGAFEVGGARAAGQAQDVEGTDALVALGQVQAAKAEFDEAAETVARLQGDLKTLSETAGLTDEQKAVAIEEFNALHQADYQALTDAQAKLGQVVADNQEGLTELLKNPDSIGDAIETDTAGGFDFEGLTDGMNGALKTVTSAMEVVSRDPAHFEAVSAITTPVLEGAQGDAAEGLSDMATKAVDMLAERVVPGLIESSIATQLGEQDPGDPNAVEKAFAAFEESPLGGAVEGLGTVKEQFENVADLQSGYRQLKDVAVGKSFVDTQNRIKADQLTGQLEELSGTGSFGRSFASMGAALNGISAAGAWNQDDPLGAAAGTVGAVGDVTGLIAEGGGKLAMFSTVSDFLGPVGDTLGAIQGVRDAGDAFREFAETGDNVALARGGLALGGAAAGVAALMSVPGANLAGVVVAGALLTVNYYEGLGDDNDSAERIMAAVDGAAEKGKFGDPGLSTIEREVYGFNLPGNKYGDTDAIMAELRKKVDISPDDEVHIDFQDALKEVVSGGFDSRKDLIQRLQNHLLDAQYSDAIITDVERGMIDELASQLGVDPADVPVPA